MGSYNPFGLLVTIGYLIVAFLAAASARSFFKVNPAGRAGDEAKARAIAWVLVGLVLLGLGLAKIFRVEAAITEHFRAGAVDAGHYDDRRDQQMIDLILVLGISIPLMLALMALLRHAGERALGAFGVAMMLVIFVGVRMLSYHDLDVLLSISIHKLNVSNGIELTGLVVIAILAESRPSSSWISQSVSSHRRRRRSR